MQVKKQQLELDMEQWIDSKLGKECIKVVLSPCLFNLYAEYIMRNAGLEEAQAGINIAGRNINNLRYADDTTLMAESEELKSLLMKVKVESGIICISEVINISPSNIDSSLCFHQPSFSHDILCI